MGSRLVLTVAPDVPFPDWSVVTSTQVENALHDLLREDRMLSRWCGNFEFVRPTHAAILRSFASTGRIPSIEQLASTLKCDVETIKMHIADLVARDLVVERNGRIEGAYPFTNRDTGHVVEIDGTAINVMCAIDALGVGSMFERATTIRSRCHHCQQPIIIETGLHGQSIAHQSPKSALVWVGVQQIDGCAADTQCQSMVYFCSQDHLLDWKATAAQGTTGYQLNLTEALEAGGAIFRPFLATR